MREPRKPANLRVVEDTHALVAWVIPKLDHFPRSRRFTLGARIEGGLLDVLELLVDAAYRREKGDCLRNANLRLAVVRHLWRMAMELGVISRSAWATGAGKIDAIGKQVGAWYRGLGQSRS